MKTPTPLHRWLALVAPALAPLAAHAACLGDEQVRVLYDDHLARRPSPNRQGLGADPARQVRALKRGDVVSLGSLSRLLPPEAGQAVEVQSVGLPGDPVVRGGFR